MRASQCEHNNVKMLCGVAMWQVTTCSINGNMLQWHVSTWAAWAAGWGTIADGNIDGKNCNNLSQGSRSHRFSPMVGYRGRVSISKPSMGKEDTIDDGGSTWHLECNPLHAFSGIGLKSLIIHLCAAHGIWNVTDCDATLLFWGLSWFSSLWFS